MKKELLEQGIQRYGTPLYVLDLDEMGKTIADFRGILSKRAKLCFAMKANPFLVREMAPLVDRIEICSMGEFQICKEQRIPREKRLISGVMKKAEDVHAMLEECRETCIYTIESLQQFSCFADWSNANRKECTVFLRLSSGNQFGMGQELIEEIIKKRDTCPFLNIQGIHYFSGTKKRIEKTKDELIFLDKFLLALEERTGFTVKELEFGPGLTVPYFEGEQDRKKEELSEIGETLSRMNWKGQVTLEMGRALAASCGTYLTRVQDIKQNAGRNYCIVDGGIHQMNYDGQIRGMYQPRFRVIPGGKTEGSGEEQEWTVCGALCTTNDILMQKAMIPDLEIGTALIFEAAGAYSMMEGMALFLSHPLPEITMYSKDRGWRSIRSQRQTYVDNMESMEEIEHGTINERTNGHR